MIKKLTDRKQLEALEYIYEACPQFHVWRTTHWDIFTLIAKCPNFYALSINMFAKRNKSLKMVRMESLRELNFGNSPIYAEHLDELARNFPNLRKLICRSCYRVADSNIKFLASNCPNLEDLELSFRSSSLSALSLLSFSTLTSLKRLVLTSWMGIGNVVYTPNTLDNLGTLLANCIHLQRFGLECSLPILEKISNSPVGNQLKALRLYQTTGVHKDLSFPQITAVDAKKVAKDTMVCLLKACPNIKDLSLSHFDNFDFLSFCAPGARVYVERLYLKSELVPHDVEGFWNIPIHNFSLIFQQQYWSFNHPICLCNRVKFF